MPAAALAKAEAATVLLAPETSLVLVGGSPPATGWQLFQPNPGGIQDWHPALVTVERDPLSKFASREKGDQVGLDCAPKLLMDLNKDSVEYFAPSIFRSVAKHPGNTGLSFFRPTAATATEYTVSALGALTAGLLVYARGFLTAANNGIKVVAAASAATQIKAAGLVAETVSPVNSATVEVCGVQGAVGDIGLSATGHLTSTVLNFTTLGLNVGQWIALSGVGTNSAGVSAPSGNRFANALYFGRARITAITATQITLERRTWTVGAADNGAGKSIWILFGRWYRNVPMDNADYLESSHSGEVNDIGPGTGSTAIYTYGTGLTLKTFDLDMPIESKMITTYSFIGTNITDPVLAASRVTGPSAAILPIASALVDTANDIGRARLGDRADEDSLIAELNSCKLTVEHNVKPRKQLGTFGAAGMTFGKFDVSATFEAYFVNMEAVQAVRDNRDCAFDVLTNNGQFGAVFDLPLVAVRGGAKSYAANEPVMLSCSVPGFRDPLTNIVASLSLFPFLV